VEVFSAEQSELPGAVHAFLCGVADPIFNHGTGDRAPLAALARRADLSQKMLPRLRSDDAADRAAALETLDLMVQQARKELLSGARATDIERSVNAWLATTLGPLVAAAQAASE
jgi:hypothetical protein